jgi:hypothetical protein
MKNSEEAEDERELRERHVVQELSLAKELRSSWSH